MRNGTRLGLLVVGGLGASIAVFVACSSTPVVPVNNNNNAVACVASAGGFPDPKCDPSNNSCPGKGTACKIDKVKCGDPATCMPLADNTGKSVVDLRIRRLNVVAPPSLATGVIPGVVTKGVDLKRPDCGENGDNAFNWLIRLDKTANTVVTGGAPPVADPVTTGYCFFKKTIGGLDIQREQVKATITGSTFTTEAIPLLSVPIFVGGEIANTVILPIREAVLKSATLSADGNCVGAFNPKALDDTCSLLDPDTCSKWRTDGVIGGYITLEDSDKVMIDVVSSSLCVLLTKSAKDPATNKCKRVNGQIDGAGDFCSTTKSSGGCKDSFWLSATFAASAVKINDGAADPNCQGGVVPTDGGTDSGSNDASSDAPADGG